MNGCINANPIWSEELFHDEIKRVSLEDVHYVSVHYKENWKMEFNSA